MLKSAQNYASTINSLMWETAYDLHYKYALLGYSRDYESESSNYNVHSFASIDEETGEVLGFLKYEVEQRTNIALNLTMVSFIDLKTPTLRKRYIFGNDVKTLLDNIFNKFNYDKIAFSMAVGNPVEKHYDKFIKKFGGRIVGVYKKHIKLIDGEMCDLKMYELFKEDYNASISKTKLKC